MRDEIGDMLTDNYCRMVITRHIVEEFISRSGDPHLWGTGPNVYLLGEIIAETGMYWGEFDIRDVVGYIWSVFISPLHDNLCHEWNRLKGVCSQCGEDVTPVFVLMETAETDYLVGHHIIIAIF